MRFATSLAFASILGCACAQLRPDVAVGASTPLEDKTSICDVLDYGAKADSKTDLGIALQKAHDQCVRNNPGTRILIPEGNYLMKTGVTLMNGVSFAIEIRGLIVRDKDMKEANMLTVYKAKDVEVFGVDGAAFQGHGYLNRIAGRPASTRILRFEQVTELTVRDLYLIDSPTFALTTNNVKNADISGITVRAQNLGMTDGIDVSGDNIYVHDSVITNRDDCVAVKNPASNVLIEGITCNHSAGVSLGSFQKGTKVENIEIASIQTYQCYHFFMIKLFKDGDGYIRNVYVHDVSGYDNNYGIDVDAYWLHIGQTGGSTGVHMSNIRMENFHGTTNSGKLRGAVRFLAPDASPAEEISFSNINIWDPHAKKMKYSCINGYGEGLCLQPPSQRRKPRFVNEHYETTPPKGFSMPQKPSWAINGFSGKQQIPVM